MIQGRPIGREARRKGTVRHPLHEEELPDCSQLSPLVLVGGALVLVSGVLVMVLPRKCGDHRQGRHADGSATSVSANTKQRWKQH